MKKLILSFIFLLLSCFSFETPDVSADDVIKIGVILPLTGDMSAVGAACRDAAQMALDDASKTSTKKYQLIFENDRLSPPEVAKAAQKLISVDKVSAIVSTWSYGGSIVSPIAERAKIPHIGVAWDHRVADGDFNFLHLTPPSEFMKKFLEVFKKLGVTRVALLGIEESGSVFALDEFIRMAPKYGVEVVYRDAVLWDTKELKSIVTKIASTKPQYLIYNLGGQALNNALLNSIKEQKVTFQYTAITSFDVMEDLKPIDGLWYVSDSYLPDEFAERFHYRYSHLIRYGIGNFYEAVRLLINAFEQAKTFSPIEAKVNLLNVKNVESIFGPTSVDAAGIFSYPAKYIRVENGQRKVISAEEIRQ